jgi:hypothetical protein
VGNAGPINANRNGWNCSKLFSTHRPAIGEKAMKNVVVVCLMLVSLASSSSPSSETFTLANRIGEPNKSAFFLFSTSAGKYTIRHDGLSEVSLPKEIRRRYFQLKVGAKGRVERVYFHEHEGDLLLLYDVTGQGSYLVRIEQKTRKLRWLTPVTNISEPDQAPLIKGDVVIIGTIEISTADGRVVNRIISNSN